MFEYECAINTSGSICAHIVRFYQNTVGNPPIYAIINSETLRAFKGFEKVQLIESESDKGDKCHMDIVGADDKDCEKFTKHHFKSPNIYLCCKGNSTLLTKDQFENMLEVSADCAD